MPTRDAYDLVLLIILLACGGCGPRLSEKDVGSPIFEIPKLPGSDTPYPLPQLDDAAAPSEQALGRNSNAGTPKAVTASESPTKAQPASAGAEPVAPARPEPIKQP
jgi:hypothetical protein